MNRIGSLVSHIIDHAVFRWRLLRERPLQRVDHSAVVDNVVDAGGLTARYAFMAVMSCGIAILGLLQSSAAVVIGAMLISPLMGPIVQLGFSLCVVDFHMMRRALMALAAGVALALGTAMCIVWASPLQEATSEILARTQPTLFDLLVAILSGLAGGYAVITRKGEAIVGVAIATALMPPLAVVAFGLATGNFQVAGGAFFLFMTNLLAIAFSVTLIAKWYGFGLNNSPQHTAWQATVIVATFLLLAVPLGVALRNISTQTWAANQARSIVQRYLDVHQGSIELINVQRNDRSYRVELVAMVPRYIPNAQQELDARISARLGKPATVRIRQTLEASDSGRRDRADLDALRLEVNALTQQSARLRWQADAATIADVHQWLGDRQAEVAVDGLQQTITVALLPTPEAEASELPQQDSPDEDESVQLRRRLSVAFPHWRIQVLRPQLDSRGEGSQAATGTVEPPAA
ncbi:DUF389 domain-containing protein [Stenotrophomonas indicatrix]|uniref:DUF389 domain-containing protein n=1 Tax=Stenotrophomonas indicatrix TaxID=2045451 RepID=UPI0008C3EAC3|nr:DUF389 domain-containing protein [Stenotrophomonas indicatrix]SET24635.1 uncharacterized hydrophobic domain-containing protein [Stenotrophomonas indicatrix]